MRTDTGLMRLSVSLHTWKATGAGDVQQGVAAGSEKDAVAGLDGLPECCGRQRHGIGAIWAGVAERIDRGGLFPFWIGPLSLERRSLAICLCSRLGAGNGVNNGINGVILTLLPSFKIRVTHFLPG